MGRTSAYVCLPGHEQDRTKDVAAFGHGIRKTEHACTQDRVAQIDDARRNAGDALDMLQLGRKVFAQLRQEETYVAAVRVCQGKAFAVVDRVLLEIRAIDSTRAVLRVVVVHKSGALVVGIVPTTRHGRRVSYFIKMVKKRPRGRSDADLGDDDVDERLQFGERPGSTYMWRDVVISAEQVAEEQQRYREAREQASATQWRQPASNRPLTVPTLQDLCLDMLAANIEHISSLVGLPDELANAILVRSMGRADSDSDNSITSGSTGAEIPPNRCTVADSF